MAHLLRNIRAELAAIIKYDVLRLALPVVAYPSQIPLTLHKDGNVLIAESEKYPGFVASAYTMDKLVTEIFDTILVYFDVPHAIAKRLPYPTTMKISDDTGKEVVVRTITHAVLSLKT